MGQYTLVDVGGVPTDGGNYVTGSKTCIYSDIISWECRIFVCSKSSRNALLLPPTMRGKDVSGRCREVFKRVIVFYIPISDAHTLLAMNTKPTNAHTYMYVHVCTFLAYFPPPPTLSPFLSLSLSLSISIAFLLSFVLSLVPSLSLV